MTDTPYTPLSRQQILANFDATVHERVSLAREIAAKTAKQPMAASNRYQQQAINQRSKQPSSTKKARQTSRGQSKICKDPHNEGQLQKQIEAHPFLLRTPELYAGGLYLDSIITQHTLPNQLRPDFFYVTTQGTVIKLVFVEIKSSKFNVFTTDSQFKGMLHKDTVQPLNQVRGYKRSLQRHAVIDVLLQNLEPLLFERYPIQILNEEGKLNTGIHIEISFMLVMGTDMLNKPWQQSLIDELYLNEGIIMMTYPMMMAEVSQEDEVKNCLRVRARSVEASSIHKRDLLLAKVPSLSTGPAPLHDPDPYGVALAGLGWPRAGAHSLHPQSMVSMFHRAQGKCERPDCTNPIVREGSFMGGLSSIFNFFKPGLPCRPYLLQHMGLFCSEHHQDVNDGERYPIDRPHPLRASLDVTRPYRFQTDRERQVFLKQATVRRTDAFCSSLGIDPSNHPDIYAHIGQRLAALTSLPIDLHKKMSAVISQYYGIDRPAHTYHQPLADIVQNHDVQRLLRAGMIELEVEGASIKIQPTVIDQGLIEVVMERFPRQASVILMGLCFGDLWLVQLGVNQASRSMSTQV